MLKFQLRRPRRLCAFVEIAAARLLKFDSGRREANNFINRIREYAGVYDVSVVPSGWRSKDVE